MAPEDLMKGLILTALQDDDVQNLFKSLMEQCRDYEEVEGITTSSYRDTVLEQIAGSVSSFLLNKSNSETPGDNTGGCLHDSKVSCGELGEPATPHQVEPSHDTNSSTNNTNPTPQSNHASPVNLQQNVANIIVGGFEEATNNTHASSQDVPDIKRSSSNEEDNLCGKILVKTQTDEETMLCNSEPHGVHYDQTGNESEEELATLKTHDELPQAPYVYFLKANGYNEGETTKMASYISDLSHIDTAAQVNREHDLWDSGLTNKTKMQILSDFQKETQEDDPCLKMTKDGKDGEDDSSDEDYQSMADQMDEAERLNLNSDHGDEHQSASDNDDLETCYSSEGINLSRTSSASGFITATNSIEELKTESTQETRKDKIVRPQFLGNLYVTKLANARQTAAQLKARKPEPRVKIEKPVHLDTDLMYSVRHSLKRSLPKVAGKNNLSALMMMADGMFQEMSLDRDLDELAWPYDPLAELRESGLALVDYMEPTPSVPTADKRPTHINSWEEKSVRVPSKLSLPLIFSRNVNCSEKQDTPTEKLNAVSTTSQIVQGGRRGITMDHIKPIGGINRFSELFGQIMRMPRIPVMILQSALNPFKRGITHPQVTDISIDGETVNEAMVPFYRKPSQPLSIEGARSKSLPKITTNYQLIPIETNKEAHMERCVARNIRPQFLGKFYQKNIIDSLQTTAEIKARTSWSKVKLGNPVQRNAVCQSLVRSLPKTAGKNKLSALMTLADEMFEEMPLDRQIYSDFDPLVKLNSSDLLVDQMRPSRALLGPSTDLDEIPSSQAVKGSESKWPTTQCSLDIQDLHAGYQNKGLDSPSGETPDEEATLSASDCSLGSQEVVSTEEDMSQDIETQKTAKIVQDDALHDALTLHSPNEMNDPAECLREEYGPETSSQKDEDNLSEDSALGKDRSTTSLLEDDESIDCQTADSTFSSNHFEQFAKQGNSDIDDDAGNSPIIQLPNRSRRMEEKVSQFLNCDPCDDSNNSVVARNVSPDMKNRIDMFEAFQKQNTST